MINNGSRSLRQHQLFGTLLLERGEIFLVRLADRSKNHRIGTDHPLQTHHLPGTGYTRFDQRQLLVPFDHQQRERHAQLRIITFRRPEIFDAGRNLLGDPLLDHRLPVRTRNTDHAPLEPSPVMGRKLLEGSDGTRNHHVAATGRKLRFPLRKKCLHIPANHLADKGVGVVISTFHGHEQRLLAERTVAAVGKHPCHRQILPDEFAPANAGDFR